MGNIATKKILIQAGKLCKKRYVRLTPQRLEVLRLISLQHSAISAYNLLDLLRKREPKAKPPTVYRALNFLLKQGFVHKVESINSYVLCHLFGLPTLHTSVMFICDRCCVVKERYTKKIDNIMRKLAKNMHFTLHHNIIEVHGFCANCISMSAYCNQKIILDNS